MSDSKRKQAEFQASTKMREAAQEFYEQTGKQIGNVEFEWGEVTRSGETVVASLRTTMRGTGGM